ncbi:hypothetical protein ES708_16207 [subsurface metagenome]
MSFPRRGEVFRGPGKKKIRPLLVVSNDQGNRYSDDVVVIPGTTQKKIQFTRWKFWLQKDFLNLQNFKQTLFLLSAKKSLVKKLLNFLPILWLMLTQPFKLSLI